MNTKLTTLVLTALLAMSGSAGAAGPYPIATDEGAVNERYFGSIVEDYPVAPFQQWFEEHYKERLEKIRFGNESMRLRDEAWERYLRLTSPVCRCQAAVVAVASEATGLKDARDARFRALLERARKR